MSVRFLTSNTSGVETPWLDIDSLLDALETGRLDPDDYVFDQIRQAWQPLKKHSGIVRAWDQRMGFRPPEERVLISSVRRPAEGFPALSPEGITPVSSPAVSRIHARRMARSAPDETTTFHRAMGTAEVVAVVILLTLLTVGLVWVVRGVMQAVR